MTPAKQKNHFSIIQEQLESKKVVTFKWLSKKCRIHNTVAKRVLQEFVNESAENKYSVTYLVFSKGPNGSLAISLNDENDLSEDVDVSSVIDKQIYSVECRSSDISSEILYNDEKLSFQLEQMSLSSINYPSEVCKNPNLRRLNNSIISNSKNSAEEKSDKPSTSNFKVEHKKEKMNKLNFTALPKSKNEEKLENKTEEKLPKKSPDKTESEAKVKNTKASKACTVGKGSLSLLFQNHRVKNISSSTSAALKEDKNNENETKNSALKEKPDNCETVKDESSKEIQSAKQSSPVLSKKTLKTAKKSVTKSRKKPVKKNRKRISASFDSSSDESNSNADLSEEELPFEQLEEEPEPEQSLEPELEPNTSIVQGKKRKRRVVNKNVLGDDGYFYTEKEVVYESCESDDNDENNPNINREYNKRLKTSETENNTSTVSKTKAVSPTAEKTSVKNNKTKTKQASIMNFFKKS